MSRVHPFDDAATARAVIDDDGTLVEWNEDARRLLGHPAETVVGRPAVRLLAGDGGTPVPSRARWEGTVELRHRDGRAVPVRLIAHRRPPAAGRGGDWLVVTPPTGTRLPAVGDPLAAAGPVQSPCAVAVYDHELRLRRMNGAMAAITGLPEDRVRGLRISEINGGPQGEELERSTTRPR
ncbi:PAS domain-containing protein [Streptomyces sp. TG1A-8]|uniref:PAS domain-containing protein n=1 Tax=Streptomyces sp. TG1A-8 TaxID=3051385 RepID=UPI003463B2E7